MQHNIALVDDHHLVRAGLAATVNGMGAYRVVLEASNGREFVDDLATIKDPELRPRIAIVDLNMPVMDGFETIAWARANAPDVLCLALTFDADDDTQVKAIHAGARGFVLKKARPAELKTALDSLVMTGYYSTEELLEASMRSTEGRNREARERDRILEGITPREMEFLQQVCDPQEFTYESIADRMGVHRRTVDNYRISLFDKFGIRSKTGLVLFAMRWGLLDLSKK